MARSETVDEAISVDRRLQLAWNGHPHHVIIDNRFNTFEDKLHALELSLAKFLFVSNHESNFFCEFKYDLKKRLQLPLLPAEVEAVEELETILDLDAVLPQLIDDYPNLMDWNVDAISLLRRKQENSATYWIKILFFDTQLTYVLRRLNQESHLKYKNFMKSGETPGGLLSVNHYVYKNKTIKLRQSLDISADKTELEICCISSARSQGEIFSSSNKDSDIFDLPSFISEFDRSISGKTLNE